MSIIERAKLAYKALRGQMVFPSYGASNWLYYPSLSDYDVTLSDSSLVMAIVGWICRTLPEAPVQVVKRGSKGERDVQFNHPLPVLLDNPNPFYDGHLMWMGIYLDWVIEGNAYLLKVRNGVGAVIQLWWVPESMIEPMWDRNGDNYIDWYEYHVDGKIIKYEPSDIIHFRNGLDPYNPRKGRSPLASLVREVYTDEEAAAFSATLLKNMGVPGVILSPVNDGLSSMITQSDAEAVKDQFKAKTTGGKRGEPIVMSVGMQATVLSFNPQQMNLKDLRRLPEERVAAVMGIPAMVVGFGAGLDRSTFANFAEAREAAYESFVIPTQVLMAAALKRQLLPDFGETTGVFIEHDNSNVRVLQEDENAKAVRWSTMYEKGVATREEARSALGLPVETEVDTAIVAKGAPILGYHIESGVVSRNEARQQLGLPPEDESEDLKLRDLQTKLAVMKLAVEAGIPSEQASALVGLEVDIPAPAVTVEQVPPQLTDGKGYQTKAYSRAVQAVEQRAMSATRAYLNRQYEAAARAIEGTKERQLPLDFGDEIARLWNKFYPLIMAQSWDDVNAELGTLLAFDVENAYVQQVLSDLAKEVRRVTDTTRQEIRDLVGKQASEGWSIDDLAREIRKLKEVHSMERAQRIARTETAAAYSMASMAGYKEAGVAAVEWLVTEPCEICAPNANKVVKIGENFPSGHSHPPAHPDCRCAIAAAIG